MGRSRKGTGHSLWPVPRSTRSALSALSLHTEGVAMLSSVLRSQRTVEVSIAIMRTFVRLGEQRFAGRCMSALDRSGFGLVVPQLRDGYLHLSFVWTKTLQQSQYGLAIIPVEQSLNCSANSINFVGRKPGH